MSIIFAIRSGEFDITITEGEYSMLTFSIVHIYLGYKWVESFIMKTFNNVDTCDNLNVGTFTISAQNIIPICHGNYKTHIFSSVKLEFPKKYVENNSLICDPLCVKLFVAGYCGQMYVHDIILTQGSKSDVGHVGDDTLLGSELAKGSEYVKEIEKGSGHIGELENRVKELENYVKLLQASYTDEQKRLIELEGVLNRSAMGGPENYFIFKKDSNGLIIEIVANKELFGDSTDRDIGFACNNLNNLLGSSDCRNLVKLILKNNGNHGGLSRLPANIFSKRLLRELDLLNNRICVLPSEIGNCSNLERISLDGCGLKDLPLSFGNLKKLKYVNISGNHFVSIPDCVYLLNELETLIISGNPITFVPNDIQKLENLKELSAWGCPIMFVSEHVKAMSKLTTVAIRKVEPDDILVTDWLEFDNEVKGDLGEFMRLVMWAIFGCLCVVFIKSMM